MPPAPAPDPVPRRSTYLWYARLGAGAVLGSDAGLGTGFGLGLRYEQSSVAVDLSVEVLTANDEGAPGDEVGSGGAKLRALYFTDASSSSSPYVGAGLGYGIVHRDSADVLHEGWGLQGEISAGYEILRHERAIRLFLQADASLPFYLAEGSVFVADGSQDADALYLPTFMLSLGAALGQ
jgi:hypothetical protein